MTKQFSTILITAFSIFSTIVLVACQSPTSVSEPNNDIEDIRVQIAEPNRTTSDIEEIPLPNCGGTDKLSQTLGMYTSVSKSATVGAKATVTGGGEVQIPETAKLKLEIQVELAYQSTFESANSRVDSIGMSALAGTHVIYTILWEEQTFNSILHYSTGGNVYEVPYIYQLRVPKIDNSFEIECPSNSNGNPTPMPATSPTPTQIPESQSTLVAQPTSQPDLIVNGHSYDKPNPSSTPYCVAQETHTNGENIVDYTVIVPDGWVMMWNSWKAQWPSGSYDDDGLLIINGPWSGTVTINTGGSCSGPSEWFDFILQNRRNDYLVPSRPEFTIP